MTVREVDVKKGTRIVLEGDAEADCKRACFWWINVQVSSSVALKEQAYKEMSHLPFCLVVRSDNGPEGMEPDGIIEVSHLP